MVSGENLASPAMQREIAALQARAAAGGPIHGPVHVTTLTGGKALMIQGPLAGDGSSQVSANAVLALENQILPSTIGKVPGAN
ncbi:hypothetical protein, partial [Salmonella sp. SAL04269]|uniref:hypothetical protein n=1 Tax=Salmonella sp. SAL04269 TaxID=3159847 RepID=UPI00397A9F56